jgi:hypothetical protein
MIGRIKKISLYFNKLYFLRVGTALAHSMGVKQDSTFNIFFLTLILGFLELVSHNAMAEETPGMFLYQANGGTNQTGFIRSNVEGLFEGQKIQKKISDQFSFEMTQLKTMRKELDIYHRNTLENNTMINIGFANHLFSRIQLASTHQDINQFNQKIGLNNHTQRMYSLSQGWEGTLGEMETEGYVGVVQCTNSESEKYYAIAGMKVGKTFENNAEVFVNAAQEIQGGGSYTGMYGNQVFRKLSAMGRIPLQKRFSLLWNVGIGISQSSFEEKNQIHAAGVSTMSASIEYEIGKHTRGSIGYSHRNLLSTNHQGYDMVEGHMMSASLSIASF